MVSIGVFACIHLGLPRELIFQLSACPEDAFYFAPQVKIRKFSLFGFLTKHENEVWRAYDYEQRTFPDHPKGVSQLNPHQIPINDTYDPSPTDPVDFRP